MREQSASESGNQEHCLGVDISTTGAKAILLDERGTVIQSATIPLRVNTPHPLWSEQNPEEWWQGAVAAIRMVLQQAGLPGSRIAAVGLTGQMHGLVLLDNAGQVLRPAILWNDQRTAAQCETIRARLGKERLIQITGNDALTGFTAPKVLWVQEHEPENYTRARHLLLPKDTIRFRLTGEFAMDKADGSGTLLFDLKNRNWSGEILDALEIPEGWMPPTFEGPEITGRISAAAATDTGLAVGTPVVAGAGDQAAQAVGVGAIQPGIVALTLGTSGVIFVSTEKPLVEPEGRLHAFCHALPNHWHLMGVMLSAAGSLQWYRTQLAPEMSYDALLAEAEAAPAGSEGLIFLPYLSGERTPYPDPLARGAWVGITVRQSRGHLTRALLEGVAFGLKDCLGLLQQVGVGLDSFLSRATPVRISGGGARSALWRQILASILNAELVTVNTTEGAAYGAALLAGVGAGWWRDVPEACQATIRITGQTSPDPGQVSVYQDLYRTFRALYPALKPTFHAIGA
jgi:xylulokinase